MVFEKMDNPQDVKLNRDKYRHVKVLWACLEIFCFGGLEVGWGSLIYVLKDEGVYANLCHDDTYGNITSANSSMKPQEISVTSSRGCPAQDLRLNLLYTVGTGSALFFHLVGGQIFSRFGTRVIRCIYICFFWAGCVMVAFTTPELPWLICPGVLFITGGSLVFLSTATQFSNLYQKGSIVVIGLTNGFMDSSSVIQLFVKLAHQSGFKRMYSYFIIVAASLTVMASTFLIYPRYFLLKDSEKSTNQSDKSTVKKEDHTGSTIRVMQFRKYVLNRIFIPHILWFGIMMLHFNFFVATINTYLNFLTNKHKPTVSHFTNVLSYALFCGLISSLLAGLLYDKQKQKYAGHRDSAIRKIMPAILPMVVATTLMLLQAIMMMIPRTWILYPAFVDFAVFRSFLFCVSMSFLSDVFPTQAFGILYTVMLTQSSIMHYVEYGLYDWWESYDGAIWHVKTFLLVLSIVAFVHPLTLWFNARKHQQALKKAPQSAVRSGYFSVVYGDDIPDDDYDDDYDGGGDDAGDQRRPEHGDMTD